MTTHRSPSAVAVALLAASIAVSGASAHRPWFNLNGSPDPAHAYRIKDLGISQVIYGGFADAGRIDLYSLEAPADFSADLQVVVPDVPACAAFRPRMTLLGPNLSATEIAAAIDRLRSPIATPAATATADAWGTFYEPFTKTTYATGPAIRKALDGGFYLVAIDEPAGKTGTYGLSLGGSERRGGDPAFLAKIGPILGCTPPSLTSGSPTAAS